MKVRMEALTDFTPAIGTNVRQHPLSDRDSQRSPLWQYVLVWADGSTDQSGWLFDSEAEARAYAVKAVKTAQGHALRVVVDFDDYVSKGLIAPS